MRSAKRLLLILIIARCALYVVSIDRAATELYPPAPQPAEVGVTVFEVVQDAPLVVGDTALAGVHEAVSP